MDAAIIAAEAPKTAPEPASAAADPGSSDDDEYDAKQYCVCREPYDGRSVTCHVSPTLHSQVLDS